MDRVRPKPRNSNVELLRIACMILIVLHHYGVYGFDALELPHTLNRYVVSFCSLGGKIGVACFMLISGYYMVYSKFTLRKLVKLAAEAWFYSVGIGLLFLTVLEPAGPIGLVDFLRMFLPIGHRLNWFMADYVVVMLASPFLNVLVAHMSQKTHAGLLAGVTALWWILPCLTLGKYGFDDLRLLVALYLYAAYIRKYVDVEKRNARRHFLVALLSFLMIAATAAALIYLGYRFGIQTFIEKNRFFAGLYSPFVLLASVELFIGIIKLKPRYIRPVNVLASATLGVYLIHDNRMFRPYLWRTLLRVPEMYDRPCLILHALACTALVYLGCSCVDLIRQYSVERALLRVWDANYPRWRDGALHAAQSSTPRARYYG